MCMRIETLENLPNLLQNLGIAGVFQPTVRFKQSGAQSTQLRPT